MPHLDRTPFRYGCLLIALVFTATTYAAEPDPNSVKHVLFLPGPPSHAYGSHDHLAGCILLAKSLNISGLPVEATVHHYGWPEDRRKLDGIDCLVMYGDGGNGHMVMGHIDELDSLASRGMGIVCLHYAVEVPKGPPGDAFRRWIGGYYETNWSVNPFWTAKFADLPKHPITRGVQPFEMYDEWYYHMRFREGMQGVTPILSDLPSSETLVRPDGPHSGNKFVRASVARHERQTVAWAAERQDGGRGFGFTGGHTHWNWSDPNFRKIVLNAIVWCAKAEVPPNGVTDRPITLADLETDHDEKPPADFDREQVRKQFHLPAD